MLLLLATLTGIRKGAEVGEGSSRVQEIVLKWKKRVQQDNVTFMWSSSFAKWEISDHVKLWLLVKIKIIQKAHNVCGRMYSCKRSSILVLVLLLLLGNHLFIISHLHGLGIEPNLTQLNRDHEQTNSWIMTVLLRVTETLPHSRISPLVLATQPPPLDWLLYKTLSG